MEREGFEEEEEWCEKPHRHHHHNHRHGKAVALEIRPEKGIQMGVQITDAQKVALTVHAVDAAGNSAVDTNAITWSVSDPALLTLQDNGDGTAEVTAAGPEGTGTVMVSDGTLTGSIDVEVIGGPATALSIASGTPEAK